MAKYKPEQVKRALTELVLADGNITRTLPVLESAGLPVPERTLRVWRDETHADLYRQLESEREEQAIRLLTEQTERAARTGGQVEERFAAILLSMDEERLRSLSPGVLANALKAATTSKAINIDKLNALTGRPTSIVRNESVADMLRVLATRFGGIVDVKTDLIEGEADEIPPDALPRGPESAPNGNS